MAHAMTHSRTQLDVQAPAVTAEADLANGFPSLSIVGLPETAVKESKELVRDTLLTNHFEFPARRITSNMAPADRPKDGGHARSRHRPQLGAARRPHPGSRITHRGR